MNCLSMVKKNKNAYHPSDEEKDDKHALPLSSSKILHFVTLKRMFLHFLSWASITECFVNFKK